jgi:hypothetical protein
MCQKIDLHDRWGFGHYRYMALQYSAHFGCIVCQYLISHIKKTESLTRADLIIRPQQSLLIYKYDTFGEEVFEIFTDHGTYVTFHKLDTMSE